MEVKMNIFPGHVNVLEITQTEKEVAAEVIKRLGTDGLCVRDGKVMRWVKNPYYDDFAEHTHNSPGRYQVVSEEKEDVELLKAAELVIKALTTKQKIGKKPQF